MTHPTDALRLVPTNDDVPTNRKLARALSNHPEVMVVERSDPTLELTERSLEEVLDDLAAAPASPLPGGGTDLDALEKLADEATPGEWTVYGERIDSNRMLAAEEALAQVNLTEQVSSHFWMLNADGKCPALTGCGPTSEANAAFIAAANPATIKTLIAELKEARGLLSEWMGTWDIDASGRGIVPIADDTRAFLARNGKGEEPHTPRNAPRGLSDEC